MAFYKQIPVPTQELFSLEQFIGESIPPRGKGLAKKVEISAGVCASAEDLMSTDGKLAGVLIFIPCLRKNNINWPKEV